MVLVGQAQRLSVPLTRRQRRGIAAAGVGALLALVVCVVLIVTLHSHDAVSRHGCINMVAASATGSAPVHECGVQARALCRQEFAGNDAFAAAVQRQCALAGIRRRDV